MRLGLGLGFSRGGKRPNRAPSDIAWAGSHSVAEDAALGHQIGGALSATDPDVGATLTFSLADDAGGRFAIGADGASIVLVGVLDYETATSHAITVRASDGALTFDEVFTVSVTDVSESEGENPLPPDGEVIVDDAASYDVLPSITIVDQGAKLHGKKKANGASGKFIYDYLDPTANTTIVIHYDPDFSQLADLGVGAFVGFGFKDDNSFQLIGPKGDGSTGLHKAKITGASPSGWSQTTGHTISDGGAVAHGTQAGPNWIALTFSADGSTATLRSSADAAIWSNEYVAAAPSPLSSWIGNDVSGVAVYLPATSSGPFSVNFLAAYVVPAPTITSTDTASVAENATLAKSLTSNQTVTWSIVGGADQAKFELSGSTLRFASNGTKNFEAPDDADANNTYIVTVRATNVFGQATDQTVTATVTDVAEPTLDAYTTGLTGAWSMGRQLLTSFGAGSRYTDTGGFVSTLFDQAGSARDMSAGGGVMPAVATVGSRTVADFTPSAHVLGLSVALSNLITNSAGTIVWVGTLDALQASVSVLFRDLTVNIQLAVVTSTSQASAYNDGGAVSVTGAGMAVTPGTPCVISWRHSGGVLYGSVNGGTEISASSGNTASLGSALQLGYTGGGGVFGFDGKLEEFYTWNVSLSPSDLAAVIQQAKTYVGI